MNNTKSQNGNLYSLTLLVKKNKKNSEKSGLTSEREKTGGGWVWLLPGRPQTGDAMEAFRNARKHKKPIICVQNIHFPANTERKRPKIDHKRPKIDRPP